MSSSDSDNESDQSSRKRRKRHHRNDSSDILGLKNANISTGPSGATQQSGISLPSSIMNVLSQLPAASTYNCMFLFFFLSLSYTNNILVPVLDPAKLVAYLRDLNIPGEN